MREAWTDAQARTILRQLFDRAVASAVPARAIARHLPEKPRGRCVVVGAGKASAAMAAAFEAAWPDVNVSGVVVTRYGHGVPAGRIRIMEAAHPVPDMSSVMAARAILDAVSDLGKNDLVVALMSGGGSALMTLPAGHMTLADKRVVNQALLLSGATIAEMNAVRKHLSAIKGGRLALATRPARLVTLLISDVPGDDPSTIASGPTVPDPSTLADVAEIIARLNLKLPDAAKAVLSTAEETPKPGEIVGEVHIIAAPSQALIAMADAARAAGLTPLILGDAIEGEAHEVGTVMAGIARSARTHGWPVAPPAVLLSGGETTVTIGSGRPGKGGRNTEFLLGFAVAAQGRTGVWAIAGDSDGIDGTEDAAGALVAPDTLSRGRACGLDARQSPAAHDSYSYFDKLGDLVRTGPTLTNVNDIRAVLIT
jgi:glycerate 2-kinase